MELRGLQTISGRDATNPRSDERQASRRTAQVGAADVMHDRHVSPGVARDPWEIIGE